MAAQLLKIRSFKVKFSRGDILSVLNQCYISELFWWGEGRWQFQLAVLRNKRNYVF